MTTSTNVVLMLTNTVHFCFKPNGAGYDASPIYLLEKGQTQMREAKGNILTTECDALCITTNGFVKKDGSCVMGRGIAKQIKAVIPAISKDLGSLILKKGHIVQVIYEETDNRPAILSFPVKPRSKTCEGNDYVSHMSFQIGQTIPGWACKAIPDIIVESARELVYLVDSKGYETVLLPRAGCGAGELSWSDIKPLLSDILDDRFIAMSF